MTIFVLKIIACITMVIDHIKYVDPSLIDFVTKNFGRISFPLFAFFIAEGYAHTKDLKEYYKRLFAFALISQIPFMLFRTLVGEWKMLNILFTLILGLSCITIYDKFEKKYLALPICILIIYLGNILRVDYRWYGVALPFVIYLGRKNKLWLSVLYVAVTYLYFYLKKWNLADNYMQFIFCLAPLIFILLYNGKKGRDTKQFFYWFYPVHMLFLYAISVL